VQVDDDVLVEVGMGVGPVGFGVEQQDLLWGMWRGGESIRAMERALAVSLPRIQRFLRQTGGIRPGPQRRREGHLAAGEREEISRGIAAGLSGRVIAGRLGRSPSTVSREIDRNGGRDAYRAVDADAAAYGRARRPKPSKLATDPVLRERVSTKLVEDWSPQQIAARLRLQHPDEPGLRVSHETIYRDLYMPSRGVFDAGMFHRLRSERPIRHDLPWLRSARWFFLATTSLTLSCMTIALQDGPAPTSGAENGQHGPSWLTVLVVNPVRLA